MATFLISEAFRGASPPAPWFRVLEIDPISSASQLLFGTGDFSTYQAAEPLHLALQWLREVRDPSFAGALDLALGAWVEKFWGMSIHPDSAASASLTAEAWQNLSLILTGYPAFESAASALRERVLAERNFLLAIGEGPTSDPAGRALQAISRYQKDLTLRDYWWELSALPPSAPWFHGEYAIDGLCHLPFDGKGIPDLIPSGLRRLAVGLSLRVAEGWLDPSLARRYFLRIVQLTQRRFPFEERWRRFWLGTYRSVSDETVKAWIQSLYGFSEDQRLDSGIATGAAKPNPRWLDRVRSIANRLAVDDPNALDDAYNLLAEQEAYLYQTGDAHFFVRSACNFGTRIEIRHPKQALEWAQRARTAEPSDPFPWTIEFNCLRRMDRTAEAIALALETVARFPQSVVARTGLGEVLKARGRLDEAEQVYRETVAHFPQNVVARNGLGEVLKARGRLDEAEQVYRETVAHFPQDVVARNGLGEVLKARGRLEEAEQVYRETVAHFPQNVVARNGLGEVLKARGRLDEAEQVYRETVAHFPQDAVAHSGLGEVLKARGQLEEAEQVYRDTVAHFPQNVFARSGLGEVLKARGRLEQAEQVYRDTVAHFPQDVVARNGLGEVLKARGRLDEAEQVYRDTVSHFPQNVFARSGLGEVLKARGRLDEAERIPPEKNGESIGADGGIGEMLSETRVDEDSSQHNQELDVSHGTTIPPSLEAQPAPQSQTVEGPAHRDEQVAARLQPADVEILLTEFVLLRKWSPEGRSVAQIRERLRALMSRVGPHLFDDAVLASEEAHLLLISDLDEALSFLKEAVRHFPGSVKVAYARARAERLWIKRLRPQLHSDPGQEALIAWNRLARVDSALEPLQLLGLARTLPLLRDGVELEAHTRKSLAELAFRIERMAKYSREDSLDRDWAEKVRENVFAGETIGSADQLGPLNPLFSRLEEHSEPLDYLETQYVDARAIV